MIKQIMIALKNSGVTGSKCELPLDSMHSAGKIKVDSEKCDRCRKCLTACPAGALIVSDTWLCFKPQRCIACVRCVEACGSRCISFQRSERIFLSFPFKAEERLFIFGG